MLFNKSFLLIALSILLSAQKAADAGRSYLYYDGEVELLNGHVKQIIALEPSTLGEHFFDTVTTNFDRKGYETEEITATPLDRRSKETQINTYDKNGRVVLTRHPPSPVKGIYTYNNNGYIIRVLFTPDNPQGEENWYIYNKAGYLTELDYYEKPKVVSDIIKYKYDKDMRLVETIQSSAKGKVKLRRTFDYKAYVVDAKSNWIKQKLLTKDIYPSFVNAKTRNLNRKIIYY